MTAEDVTTRIDGTPYRVPAPSDRHERIVREGFWAKLGRLLARVPFAEDAAAAYYAAFDPRTPRRVRLTLLAALAYFVLPVDAVPDVILCLGFTDDAAVLAAVLRTVGAHVREEHRVKARAALGRLRNGGQAG